MVGAGIHACFVARQRPPCPGRPATLCQHPWFPGYCPRRQHAKHVLQAAGAAALHALEARRAARPTPDAPDSVPVLAVALARAWALGSAAVAASPELLDMLLVVMERLLALPPVRRQPRALPAAAAGGSRGGWCASGRAAPAAARLRVCVCPRAEGCQGCWPCLRGVRLVWRVVHQAALRGQPAATDPPLTRARLQSDGQAHACCAAVFAARDSPRVCAALVEKQLLGRLFLGTLSASPAGAAPAATGVLARARCFLRACSTCGSRPGADCVARGGLCPKPACPCALD